MNAGEVKYGWCCRRRELKKFWLYEAETIQMLKISREEGLKEGEERFGKLISLLLAKGMTEEA